MSHKSLAGFPRDFTVRAALCHLGRSSPHTHLVCCKFPSSADPMRPGKLLRFQGEQLRRTKSSLAADRRMTPLTCKSLRVEA